MSHLKRFQSGPAIGAIGLCSVAALAGLGSVLLDPSWSARLVFSAMQMLATALAACIVVYLLQNDRKAQQFLEHLSRTSQEPFANGDAVAQMQPPGGGWANVCTRLREHITEANGRSQSVEHSRAALEVRARRNEARAQKIASILAGLTEPVIAIDHYDEVIFTNPSAEKLLSFGSSSTEKRALAELSHCEKLVELLTDTRRRKAPTQRTSELELVDSEGKAQWYSVTARSLSEDAENNPDAAANHGAVAVLRDISFQKAIQKRNAQFVSDVSHEMKTPLAGIKAYVELLLDGDAEDKHAEEEFLNVIDSQANRLQRLVENLLNIARIEAGVVNVSKQSRSLNELLEEACQVIQPSADAKRITLSVELSPMYLGVLVDRDMILQAAINLMSNAVKYTPERGHVTLRSRMEDAAVCFEVEDTGVGLSEDDCQKVFDKFYRVHKNKDMAAGTGLGLSLAKHIVEDVHGGKLTVRSKLGKGSTFSVNLPCVNQLHRAEMV